MMKKLFFNKIMLVAMMLLTAVANLQARTVTINLSTLGSNDITAPLRAELARLSYNDKAIINFDKAGTYTLSGTVTGNCSVVMRGLGTDKSILVLDNGRDRGSFKAFTDDTFIEFTGKREHPITVVMSDFSIKLKEHKGFWWVTDYKTQSNKQQEKFAVKIYHANGVDIQRVNSTMQNAMITNLNLRVVQNVVVKNCVFTNYNNCYTGGNLWFQGEARNVEVSGCTFNKYGNDEALGFYGTTTNAYDFKNERPTDCYKTNIKVTNNTFNYGYNGRDKADMANDVLISLVTSHERNLKYGSRVENFVFSGNTITSWDVAKFTLMMTFSSSDTHRNVLVSDNKFINKPLDSNQRFYKADILVEDWSRSAKSDTIIIKNNEFASSADIVNSSNGNGLSNLHVKGGAVNFVGNHINNTVTTSPVTGKKTGSQLVWISQGEGTVKLVDNVCRGLSMMASVMSQDGVDNYAIVARNNYFQGDTRIYCDKVKHLDLNFTSNTFNCSGMNFFLQEFANEGSVVFNSNDVTAPGGQLMTHWNNNFSTNSMRFTHLEVRGNTFHGTSAEKDMFKNCTNVKRRSISSNSYR